MLVGDHRKPAPNKRRGQREADERRGESRAAKVQAGNGQKAQLSLRSELPRHPRMEMPVPHASVPPGAQTQGKTSKRERHSQARHKMFLKVA